MPGDWVLDGVAAPQPLRSAGNQHPTSVRRAGVEGLLGWGGLRVPGSRGACVRVPPYPGSTGAFPPRSGTGPGGPCRGIWAWMGCRVPIEFHTPWTSIRPVPAGPGRKISWVGGSTGSWAPGRLRREVNAGRREGGSLRPSGGLSGESPGASCDRLPGPKYCARCIVE